MKSDVSYIKVGNKKYINVINKRSLEVLKFEEDAIGFRFPTERVSIAYMKKLETIVLPKDLESFDITTGFYACTKLSRIIVEGDGDDVKFHLPEKIGKIAGPGFSGTALSEINIGKNIKMISIESIRNTKKLESINVDQDNEKFSSINGVLFNKEKTILLYYPTNKEDKEYHVPETVEKIGKNAFSDCIKLKKLFISKNVIIDGKIKNTKINEIIQ